MGRPKKNPELKLKAVGTSVTRKEKANIETEAQLRGWNNADVLRHYFRLGWKQEHEIIKLKPFE